MFDSVEAPSLVEPAVGLGLFDETHESLERMIGELVVGAMDGQEAAIGVALFSTLKNMAAAGEALCAARLAETNHWRASADRSPAHWVARTTGCSMGEALSVLEIPKRLRKLPATDFEFRSGSLSLAQARHLTEAATADPSAEAELIETARHEPLPILRDKCQRVIAAACEDDEARYRKVHDGRFLRSWTNSAGAFRMAELCRTKDEEGGTQRPRVSINITADREAWLRGRTRAGEKCEIDGAGPIPVAVAQSLVEDGVINEISMEGDDVVSLVSKSRYIPARVRRAVIARDPMCVTPGCYRRDDLQFHHWRADFSKSRRTSLDDICRACTFHHDLVTKGICLLIGGPGKWQLVPKDWYERTQSGAGPPAASSA